MDLAEEERVWARKIVFEWSIGYHRERLRPAARFILDHGRIFSTNERSLAGKRMRMKLCYRNAAELALGPGNELTYVEGYCCISGGIGHVMPHAWVVTTNNIVIDPTLRPSSSENPEYFGVPFKNSYLLESLGRNRYYGLFDGETDALSRMTLQELRASVLGLAGANAPGALGRDLGLSSLRILAFPACSSSTR